MTAIDTLRGFLDDANEAHADAPQRVADALLERAATLPADDQGAEAVRLAEHVMLGHLADAALLRGFLDRLPPVTEATTPSLQRAHWALAMLEGRSVPGLPEAPRWRALQNVVLALAGAGHGAAAQALLAQQEARAGQSGDAEARKAYAASANNVALHLRLGRRGDAARDALMLEAAAIARRAWAAAGTWLHAERADYQLALCHAVLGQGAAALQHARQCLTICEAEGADAAERFFAHEALATAQHAAGDAAAVLHERGVMQALLDEVSDPGLRAWCARALAALQPDRN